MLHYERQEEMCRAGTTLCIDSEGIAVSLIALRMDGGGIDELVYLVDRLMEGWRANEHTTVIRGRKCIERVYQYELGAEVCQTCVPHLTERITLRMFWSEWLAGKELLIDDGLGAVRNTTLNNWSKV
ncbi:hypothetical protein T07_5968 [Trichinella nelsoni]|uniref:Uncharacterized protein n=1 Tax=Trichinella nelsoni TaxID=6336 RepID=A0A0V0RPC4_9BILA|nr:hypothetical protein T07_5968 [Trichinella nelsoni]